MKNIFAPLFLLVGVSLSAQTTTIVSTLAYTWHGDTITQGQFQAFAPSEHEIISNYSAQPGYRFPVEKSWKLKNDISTYPKLKTENKLHAAIYNMGLDEMVNAVEPDTTLRTGKEWGGVWTRDVSYSIILSMAYLQPEASKISLKKKVTSNGTIVQDTGTGGAWPVSSDRMIWALAAYEVYKATGDKDWLSYIYPIIKKSLEDDALTVVSPSGLTKGETSFIDWREQSYPKWMQPADIYNSEALNTSIVQAQALETLAEISSELGLPQEAEKYHAEAAKIKESVNANLWLPENGYYAMYNYGRQFPILNPRAETLGEALAILFDVADADKAKSITENNPTTPFGVAIFYPQIADMPSYHNNALWPWVAAYWAMANAKAGNEKAVEQAIGSIFRPAALFATNKENFVLDNGDIATELNSSNMLWCLAGNIAVTHKILFGIKFLNDGITFAPFVPKSMAADRELLGFRYRNATLDISISGYGNKIKSFTLNGKPHEPFIPANITGHNTIAITMANNQIPAMNLNETGNKKAPLTPIAWLEGTDLHWNPIEYIASYTVLRDGKEIARTHTTTFDASIPGEYQVIGVAADGTPSFASEPRSTRKTIAMEMPGEGTTISSKEISYAPNGAPTGFKGAGFVETDKASAPITLNINVSQAGEYSLALRYANGNGPYNTENKCAIRTVAVNGQRAGIVVMPTRGKYNWDDWGISNYIKVHLNKGKNKVTIEFRPENNNMNIHTNHALIDQILLEKL